MYNSEQSSADPSSPNSRSAPTAPIPHESPVSTEAVRSRVSPNDQLKVEAFIEAHKSLHTSHDYYADFFRHMPVEQCTINAVVADLDGYFQAQGNGNALANA